MTTVDSQVQGLNAPEGALPDERVLEKLANQFFLSGQALPTAPVNPAPFAAGSLPAGVEAAPPPAAYSPTISELEQIPAKLGSSLRLDSQSTQVAPPSPLSSRSCLPGAPSPSPIIAAPFWPATGGPRDFQVPPSGNEISRSVTPVGAYGFLEQGRSAPSGMQIKPLAPLQAIALSLNPEQVPDLQGQRANVFDARAVRRDFPILQQQVNGHPLIWLDNGATTQKPQSVIDRIAYFYAHENSNVHRAAHTLAARSTDAYESARDKVRRFINAASANEIVFVRGATEGINLIAQSWGRQHIGKDDEIIISWLEHHANIVPWQQLCAATGAKLRVIPVDDSGQIRLDEYEKLINARTKLLAFTLVSNALGTVTPAQEIVAIAKRHGITTLVDGAQAVSHMRIDVQAIGCDFFVLSGHKVFAPTGIGVVYGREEVLEATQPWQGVAI